MPLRLLILVQAIEHLPQPEHRLDIPFPFHSCWRFSTMLPRRLQRATKPGPTAKKRRQESAKRGGHTWPSRNTALTLSGSSARTFSQLFPASTNSSSCASTDGRRQSTDCVVNSKPADATTKRQPKSNVSEGLLGLTLRKARARLRCSGVFSATCTQSTTKSTHQFTTLRVQGVDLARTDLGDS